MRQPVVAGVLCLLATPGCDSVESQAKVGGAEPTHASAGAIARDQETASSREGKRGDGRGLAGALRDITQAADDEDAALGGGPRVAVPAAIPPGDIVVEHACSHSMQPFGTGYWSDISTVDLARATIVRRRVEGDDRDAHALPGTSSDKRTETTTTLGATDVARIRDALDRVLAGGPYAPVYAVPEGIVCTLSLRVGEDPPFFRIDKSGPGAQDAVARLIEGIGARRPRAARATQEHP